jgi:N-acetylglucosaminyl-diphospho-decaprenol L-rhamnosyltransferase
VRQSGPVDVAVVVVTHNSADVVGDLLASLPAAMGDLSHDVVVVDNGSRDSTVAMLIGRDDCTVIPSTNLGYSAGINRGVKEAAPAEAILVLNPDVRLHPGSVPPMLRALGLPRTGLVAPQVRSVDGGLHHSLRREPSVLRAIGLNFTGIPALAEYVTRDADYARPAVVDWALGAVLLMSRECYDAVGGWDESYFLYSEETDLCLRARDLGYLTRYTPDAVATHIGGASGQSHATHAMQILNRVRLYRRRNGTLGAWLYYAATVASELSWAARGHRQAWFAVTCLLRPGRRPPELNAHRLMPR